MINVHKIRNSEVVSLGIFRSKSWRDPLSHESLLNLKSFESILSLFLRNCTFLL